MINFSVRFQQAIAAIDAVHAEDPGREQLGERQEPAELVYAARMSRMLERFAPDASEAVRLAARCQHLRRWEIPRSSFPPGVEGYHAWRTRQQERHAEAAAAILERAGYDDAMIARVAALLKKQALKRDPESQLLEDVVALVFFEHYLSGFAVQHPEYDATKVADILRKTARKMSAQGRAAVASLIVLPEPLAPLVREIMAEAPDRPARRSS